VLAFAMQRTPSTRPAGFLPLAIATCLAVMLGRDARPAPILARSQDQSRFRVTTFASGLAFPTSMTSLSDGSLLVATNHGGPEAWIGDHYIFTSPSATLVRLVDADRDGVADGPGQVVARDLPGLVSSVRRQGALVIAMSAGAGAQAITFWRTGTSADQPLAAAGRLSLSVPAGYVHPPCALAVRPAPGGGTELFFNVGGQFNAEASAGVITMSAEGGVTLGGNSQTIPLVAESIERVVITDNGTALTVTPPSVVATGLRNAAGLVFGPNGDLYLEDNGIDTPGNMGVSLSADELNVIRAADIGVTIPNFGFPGTYVDYATGATVGTQSGVTPPLIAFRPLAGMKSEGAVEAALAPIGFPADFSGGLFVPFSGVFNAGGSTNDENPLVFADPSTGQYFHFMETRQMGHPNGVLTLADSLFLSDLNVTGAFGGTASGIPADLNGAIYQISPVPEPSGLAIVATTCLCAAGSALPRLRSRSPGGGPTAV